MILVYLFLDVFFYNYTSFASCFFLLSYFLSSNRFFEILLLGGLFDLFILHTSGLFLLLLLLLFFVRNTIKDIHKWTHFLIAYFFLAGIFLLYSWIVFHTHIFYLFGLFLNLLILILLKKEVFK